MRVWLVNHYAIPPSRAGITRHHFFAKHLSRRGHHVTIIASCFDHVTRKGSHLDLMSEPFRVETYEGIPFLWLRTPAYSGNNIARIWNMVRFSIRLWGQKWRAEVLKPDVILGSSPHLFGALAAERVARQLKVPFVLEVRDLWPQSLIHLGNFAPSHPVVKGLEWIEKYLYRHASRIVSLLPGGAEHMAAKGADPNKVEWIPNGVDMDSLPLVRPHQHKETFTIMYAGAHGLANGLDTILDAAFILQEEGWADRIKFRFVGDGPCKPHLEKRVFSEEIKNVEFNQPVAKNEVFDILNEADAFIATLKKINLYRFGISLNKLYDYLALAKPVILGADSINNPVAEAGAGYVVPPEDGHAMAVAIKKMAGLPAKERYQMGMRGRKYVEEHHDIAKLAEKLEAVFRQAVKGEN